MIRLRPLALSLLTLCLVAACREPDPPPPPTTAVVDSIFPIEEEIRRFQETLTERPTSLSGGAPSLDSLVARFVGAVETADSAAFSPLVMSRAEFGTLYYPFTRYTRPPYELSPSLLWFQMENEQSRGLTRLFRIYFGKPIGYLGYRCEEAPRVEGENRVWDECRVLLEGAQTDTVPVRLFGSVVERAGIFKFVSFANGL